jgi:hypothetical protein
MGGCQQCLLRTARNDYTGQCKIIRKRTGIIKPLKFSLNHGRRSQWTRLKGYDWLRRLILRLLCVLSRSRTSNSISSFHSSHEGFRVHCPLLMSQCAVDAISENVMVIGKQFEVHNRIESRNVSHNGKLRGYAP